MNIDLSSHGGLSRSGLGAAVMFANEKSRNTGPVGKPRRRLCGVPSRTAPDPMAGPGLASLWRDAGLERPFFNRRGTAPHRFSCKLVIAVLVTHCLVAIPVPQKGVRGFARAHRGAGATFNQLNATQWQIHSGLDGHNEIVTFCNGAAVHASDYFFV